MTIKLPVRDSAEAVYALEYMYDKDRSSAFMDPPALGVVGYIITARYDYEDNTLIVTSSVLNTVRGICEYLPNMRDSAYEEKESIFDSYEYNEKASEYREQAREEKEYYNRF